MLQSARSYQFYQYSNWLFFYLPKKHFYLRILCIFYNSIANFWFHLFYFTISQTLCQAIRKINLADTHIIKNEHLLFLIMFFINFHQFINLCLHLGIIISHNSKFFLTLILVAHMHLISLCLIWLTVLGECSHKPLQKQENKIR